jgi:hypothetical protein
MKSANLASQIDNGSPESKGRNSVVAGTEGTLKGSALEVVPALVMSGVEGVGGGTRTVLPARGGEAEGVGPCAVMGRKAYGGGSWSWGIASVGVSVCGS